MAKIDIVKQVIKMVLEANKAILDVSTLILNTPESALTERDRVIGEILLKYFEWITSLEPLPGADSDVLRQGLPPDISAGLNELEARFRAASAPQPPSRRWL